MPDESTLRSLIRLMPPARALKEQLEKSMHLETYAGTGDAAMQMLNGLQQSVARLVNDPYIAVLAPTVPAGADDQQKVSLALLAASQLLAYMEGETGLTGSGGGGDGGNIHIQKAPMISLNNVHGIPNIEKVLDVASKPNAEG